MVSWIINRIFALALVQNIQHIHSWTPIYKHSGDILCRNGGTKLHGDGSSTSLLLSSGKSDDSQELGTQHEDNDRRQFLLSTLSKGSILGSSMLVNPCIANAAQVEEDSSSSKSSSSSSSTTIERTKPNLTQAEIYSFLHSIPTFAIVDPTGVPYMVVGEDAKLSAYFFTSYNEANRILSIAKQSADKAIKDLIKEENEKRKISGLKALNKKDIENEIGVNPWNDARISTLPLDFSVGLASRGKVAGSYFRIAPSEDDIQDALNVEASTKELSEGKVPLFYIDDFEINANDDETGGTRIPLYFQKSQLLEAYKKSRKEQKEEPIVKVTELFSILLQMAGTGQIDEDVRKLLLVPLEDAVEKAKLCDKKGGNQSPYKIGERIVVL